MKFHLFINKVLYTNIFLFIIRVIKVIRQLYSHQYTNNPIIIPDTIIINTHQHTPNITDAMADFFALDPLLLANSSFLLLRSFIDY